jgi:integrase
LTTAILCATVVRRCDTSRATNARQTRDTAIEVAVRTEDCVITKRTTNTSGEPYRDGKQRYEARVRGPNGRVITRTFRTKKLAELWERDKLGERDSGTWVGLSGGRVRFGEFAAQWLEGAVDLAPRTRQIYADNLRLHILPTFGDVPLGSITTEACEAWLIKLRKEGGPRKQLAPSSVHQAYRALHRVLAVATRSRRIGRNPLDGLDPPKVTASDMSFLNHEEVAAVADAIDVRFRAFVLVAAYCGLRAGEMRALRRRDIDLVHKTITVTRQLVDQPGGGFDIRKLKTAKSRRSVAIPPHVIGALERHLGDEGFAQPGPDGIVFTSTSGTPLRLENFRRREWTPACTAAGLGHVRIHDLRHTCASLAIAAGADVLVLQRMLGHASAAMTLDRYGHLMPGQAEEVARRLSDAAGRATSPTAAHIRPTASTTGHDRGGARRRPRAVGRP